jgi:hypothetical protein
VVRDLQLDADDAACLARFRFRLHAPERELASVMNALRQQIHLGVGTDLPERLQQALVRDVVLAAARHAHGADAEARTQHRHEIFERAALIGACDVEASQRRPRLVAPSATTIRIAMSEHPPHVP